MSQAWDEAEERSLLGRKYRIVGRVASGGMGEIYKAHHELLRQWRAIKVMRTGLPRGCGRSERFCREARLAAALQHQNIARLFDFALAKDGTAYMVLEWIDGKSLRNILDQGGLPAVSWVVEVVRQALEGLAYLHEKGIIHRDISPGNIMVTKEQDGGPLVKLIDLGIAKDLGQSDDLTGVGVFLGKPRYAPPEALGGAQALDRRGDIYSMGVVLYELLTGQPPFGSAEEPTIIGAQLRESPRSFDQVDPSGRVPAKIREATLTALERDPEWRFQSAREFAGALIAASRGLDATAQSGALTEAITLFVQPSVASSFPRLHEAQLALDNEFPLDGELRGSALPGGVQGASQGSRTADGSYSTVASTLARIVREHPAPFAALGIAIVAGVLLLTMFFEPSTAATTPLDTSSEPPVSDTTVEEERPAIDVASQAPVEPSAPRALVAIVSADASDVASLVGVFAASGIETKIFAGLQDALEESRTTSRDLFAVELDLETHPGSSEAYEVALPRCEVVGSIVALRLPAMTSLHTQQTHSTAPTCGQAAGEVKRRLAGSTAAALRQALENG